MKHVPAAFAFLLGLTAAYAHFMRHDIAQFMRVCLEHSDTTAIAGTGILAALVAVWGITSQRAITRRQVTLEHISRQENDAALIEARREFSRLAKLPDGIAKFADLDKETTEEARNIRMVLNEFELMAIGIERGIIDFEIYRLWFRSGVIRYWGYAVPFANALRARTGNEMLFHEFETMAGWFKGTRKKPKRGYRLSQWFK